LTANGLLSRGIVEDKLPKDKGIPRLYDLHIELTKVKGGHIEEALIQPIDLELDLLVVKFRW
jgi:hypothetical protein